MVRALLLALVGLTFACGKSTDSDSASAGQPPGDTAAAGATEIPAAGAGPTRLFTKEEVADPCKLLTPKMVAEVAEVAHEALQQRTLSGMCLYSWEGGNASLGFVRVGKTAADRGQRFDLEHKSMTGDEVGAAMDKVAGVIEKKQKEGEIDVDPAAVKTVAGGVASGFKKRGITFEPVDGVGDKAAFDTTKVETKIANKTFVSYANKMGVLVGNMSFTVTYSKDTGPEGGEFRDKVIGLGKAVVAGLGR